MAGTGTAVAAAASESRNMSAPEAAASSCRSRSDSCGQLQGKRKYTGNVNNNDEQRRHHTSKNQQHPSHSHRQTTAAGGRAPSAGRGTQGQRNPHRRRPRPAFVESSAAAAVTAKCCSVCSAGDPNYKCPQCRSTYCSISCCRKHKEECCAATAQSSSVASSVVVTESATGTLSTPPSSRSKYLSAAELLKLQQDQESQGIRSSTATTTTDDPYNYGDLKEGWKMTDDMVHAIKDSSWLRQELADAGLQQLIHKITAASSASNNSHDKKRQRGAPPVRAFGVTTERERVLAELKATHPQFQRFLDKLLVVAGVLERRPLLLLPGGAAAAPLRDEWLLQSRAGGDSVADHLVLQPLPRRARPAAPIKQPQPPSSSSSSESSSEQDDSSSASESGSSDDDDDDDDEE